VSGHEQASAIEQATWLAFLVLCVAVLAVVVSMVRDAISSAPPPSEDVPARSFCEARCADLDAWLIGIEIRFPAGAPEEYVCVCSTEASVDLE